MTHPLITLLLGVCPANYYLIRQPTLGGMLVPALFLLIIFAHLLSPRRIFSAIFWIGLIFLILVNVGGIKPPVLVDYPLHHALYEGLLTHTAFAMALFTCFFRNRIQDWLDRRACDQAIQQETQQTWRQEPLNTPDSEVIRLGQKALDGKRLDEREALQLLRSRNLPLLMGFANAICNRLNPLPVRTFIIDRNINYTNICLSGCRFCAFYRKPGSAEGFVLDQETLFRKVQETFDQGGEQILLQGGLNPDLSLSWFEELFQALKEKFPTLKIHALSPPEVRFLAKNANLSDREVLLRLQKAGLSSLPGGGAEILSDRIRKKLSPEKVDADGWISVMKSAHSIGLKSSATMMFGHIENFIDRIESLHRIRDLQDETNGFSAFIGWTFQPGNTMLQMERATGFDYLKSLAVSRLFLDNVPHVQASWVTQGALVGQLSLYGGADDLGSVMIEENVVRSAGVSYRMSRQEIEFLIINRGATPALRTQDYRRA